MPFLVAHRARLICQKNTDQTSTSYGISMVDVPAAAVPQKRIFVADDTMLQPLSITTVPYDIESDAFVAFQDYLRSASYIIQDDYVNDEQISMRIRPLQDVGDKHSILCQEAIIFLDRSNKCMCHAINPTSKPIKVNEGFELSMATVFEPQLIEQAYKLTDPIQNSGWDWDETIELNNIVDPYSEEAIKLARILSTSK